MRSLPEKPCIYDWQIFQANIGIDEREADPFKFRDGVVVQDAPENWVVVSWGLVGSLK